MTWDHLKNVWQSNDEPFNLSATLKSGQCFRWQRSSDGVWWGTVGDMAVACMQQDGDPSAPIFWQTFPDPDRFDLFASLFRLEVSLESLYSEWISAVPAIRSAVSAFRGLRIMRQDPVECFFSFQCASCNTVIKIERSVRKLTERYGARIRLPIEGGPEINLNSFPSVHSIRNADESLLRSDLWGFRAPRIIQLAEILDARSEDWLMNLRQAPYEEAHRELTLLPGIGAKVADCICLFCLDKDDAVPIDTHTRQVGVRLFHSEYSQRSLTAKVYNDLADSYRSHFGGYAGWAQQYLFFAELRGSASFSQRQE